MGTRSRLRNGILLAQIKLGRGAAQNSDKLYVNHRDEGFPGCNMSQQTMWLRLRSKQTRKSVMRTEAPA